MTLTRDQILDADDLKTESVPVPDWGGSVNVRTMTGHERAQLELQVNKANAKKNGQAGLAVFRELLAVECIVDDAGAKLFTRVDIARLSQKSGRALDTVADVAMRLNGMKQEEVEELVGKSEPTADDDSSSDSP